MKYRSILISLCCIVGMAAAGQKKIVILGSSTAEGIGSTSIDSSWVGRLTAFYNKNKTDGIDTTIVNLAKGGYTTYKIMPTESTPPPNRPFPSVDSNVTKALSLNPDIIIINMPSNDISNGYTKSEVMNNFRLLYETISKKSGVKAYITTTQPRDFTPNTVMMQYQHDLVDSITNVFGASSINFWNDIADGFNNIKPEVSYGDGIHVNNRGHGLLYQQVLAKSIFGQPVASVTQATRIEAESFQAMSGIITEKTADTGGGLDVTSLNNADWIEYKINAPSAGSYTLSLRVASPNTGAHLMIGRMDGTVLASLNIPNTGGYQSWQTITTKVNLLAGAQVLHIASTEIPSWNFNWMELSFSATDPTPVQPAPVSTTTTRIQAESFRAMNGITTETTTDTGGGLDVTSLNNGDWMEYAVNPPATGTYTLNLRVASPNTGAHLMIGEVDGTVLASVNLPNTGGFQTWQTVTTHVTLPAGAQIIHIASTETPAWNFNWMEFSFGATTSNQPPVVNTGGVRTQAENYVAMNGISTETTSDTGGGLDVTSLNNGDWMEYKVSASVAGTYTLNLRVAAAQAGAHLMIGEVDGTVLASLDLPNTGGQQLWQTISTKINLAAGEQLIHIASTEIPTWNFNWMELSSAASTAQATDAKENTEAYSSLVIFPNPILDHFQLKFNNADTGMMQVRILDMTGRILKSFILNKARAGAFQSYLSLEGLKAGTYLLQVNMKDGQQTRRIMKE